MPVACIRRPIPSPTLRPWALAFLMVCGCLNSRSTPPVRSSPVLAPTSDKLDLPQGFVRDARRERVIAVTTAEGVEVRKLEGGAWRTLASAKGLTSAANLVSRSDTLIAFTTSDANSVRAIHTFDGTTLTDQTARLLAVLPETPARMFQDHGAAQLMGFDLGADGSVGCFVSFEPKLDEDHAWTCWLGADGVDSCEVLAKGLVPKFVGSAQLTMEDGRTYLWLEGRLYVHDGAGGWKAVYPDPIVGFELLEGGRISFLTDSGTGLTEHVLGPDGVEESSVELPRRQLPTPSGYGQAMGGRWTVGFDYATVGDCEGWIQAPWEGPCEVVWLQYVVFFDAGSEYVEVGYVNSTGQATSGVAGLPLEDGGLYLEIEGTAYRLAPP